MIIALWVLLFVVVFVTTCICIGRVYESENIEDVLSKHRTYLPQKAADRTFELSAGCAIIYHWAIIVNNKTKEHSIDRGFGLGLPGIKGVEINLTSVKSGVDIDRPEVVCLIGGGEGVAGGIVHAYGHKVNNPNSDDYIAIGEWFGGDIGIAPGSADMYNFSKWKN